MALLKTVSLETEKKITRGKGGLKSVRRGRNTSPPGGSCLFITPFSYLIPRSSPLGLLPAARLLMKMTLSLKFLPVYEALRS